MSAADILLLLLTHAAAFFWGAAFADWTLAAHAQARQRAQPGAAVSG